MPKLIAFISKNIESHSYSIINHLCSMWYKTYLGYVGKRTIIRRHCRIEGDCSKNIQIGNGCDFDTYCVLGCRSRLFIGDKPINPLIKIGDGCVFGQYNHITAVNKIIIGNNLLTGRFVLITDNSHGGMDYEELQKHPSERRVVSKGEVIIGNNVWLGDKVSILSGVHIGDGCVIGANSVVTHDIPPYSLAGGIPAKIIKKGLGNI